MDDDGIAIKVEHVSKTFKLPHEKNNSIKSAVVNFYRRKKTFEQQHALKDISFEVKKGEFFGIVGRNGGGKSTLLKLLAGIYSPTKGSIFINGKLTPFIELGVGFNQELSGRENVFLNGALLGFNRKEIAAMYQDIVEFAELERFMDQKLKNYSSGMQVRLAFSIAIRAETAILLLDEVLAVGDAAFQQKCFDYFGRVKKENKTVVFVTHDMASVSRFCDRGFLIDKGSIQFMGKATEVAEHYKKDNFTGSKHNSAAAKSSKSKAVIKSVDILGNDSVENDEEIKLSITITSKEKTRIVLGISVLQNLFYVAGINSSKDLGEYDINEGETQIGFTLSANAIGAGNYNFGYTLFESPSYTTLDESTDGPKFQINSSTNHKDGVANINGFFSDR